MMFLHPQILWLLFIPLVVAIYQLRTSTDTVFRRKVQSAGLRILVLSMLVLAIARPCLVRNETTRRVVAVVDCSPSMKSVMGQTAERLKVLVDGIGFKNMRLVVFGSKASEIKLNKDVLSADGLQKLCQNDVGSDIAQAIELASALCPDNGNGDVYLFSDGRETQGNMADAAAALGRRGLTLKIEQFGTRSTDPVLTRPLEAPASAAVGEAVVITARIESSESRKASVTLTDDAGKPLISNTVALNPGVQEMSFRVHPDRVGFLNYSVSLEGTAQSVSTGILVNRMVVGVFETAPGTPARLMIANILGQNAEVKSLTLDDLTGKGLASVDVLALADTPIKALSIETQLTIRHWVEGGGGLLVTGGRNTFGPGGFENSRLAPILPLRFPQKKEVRDPSTALAVIIDTSGSMGAEGVSLAQEVARLALKRLKPHDKAGIVEFHGAKRWAAPMQPASNIVAIQRALNRLSPGGGTVMLPAIEEAYYGLMNVRTRTKHVLLLTDGGVETGPYESLIRSMADDRIHVSTVLVGPRAGSGFLVRLANWGGGQFYVAPNRFKLPEVIFKQPSSSLMKPFVEDSMRIVPGITSELTRGIVFDTAPTIQGYVRTEPKETSELLLRSEIGDPVLARWHYGLGRSAILTTRFGGEWSKRFFDWPTSRDLMASLVRQLCGVSSRKSVDLRIGWSAKGIDVDLHALSATPSLGAEPLRVAVRDRSGMVVAERTLMPVQANQWQTRFERVAPGDYIVEVNRDEDGKSLASGGLVIPSPVEFTRVGVNTDGLTAVELAAGKARSTNGERPSLSASELWPFCATTALVCFVLMIFARRLPGTFSLVRRLNRRGATALMLLAVFVCLALPRNAHAQHPALNIFLRMRVEQIVIIRDAAEARKAMKDYIPRIKWKHKNLAPLCGFLRSKPNALQAKTLLALALTENGDYGEAEEVLLELSRKTVVDPWVHGQLLRVRELAEEKKYRKKEKKAQNVLTAADKALIGRIVPMEDSAKAREALKGLCDTLTQRFGDLALLCDHLRSMTPPAARPLLAQALSANGEIHEAEKVLSPLVQKPGADLLLVSELARIKEMLGQKKEAIPLLERALKLTTNPGMRFALRVRLAQLRYDADERDAARAVLRSIANDPAVQGQEGHNYCARIAGLYGDDELVVELFKPTGEGRAKRRNLIFLGESNMRVGKPGEARKLFRSALDLCELERDRRYVLDRLVCAARAMNALPDLMDEWLKSKEMFPEQLDILAGIMGGELDRTEDVLGLLECQDLPKKTRELIETPEFQERLAMIASETGKSKLARLTYRELIARRPKDPHCRNGYVRLLLMEGDRTSAESVYREAISRSEKADELLEIAASARDLGLKDVSIKAIRTAETMDESAHVKTALFMADMHRDAGDTDKAIEIVRKLEREAKAEDGLLMVLVKAYERHGYPNDAIRLLQSVDLAGKEKALFKLISLLEEQNRNDEAFEIWRQLWDTATEKMAIIQANDRLLDIGSKTGKLADLAIELEERLDKGQLREREQSLLLDIYTSVSDPVSAADILMEISDQQDAAAVNTEERLRATIDTYKRLLRVYMECELFGRCNAVLNKLIELDPKNRDEHLQTLVLIALERKNDGDAQVVLEKMARKSEDGILRDSFAASVLRMIGKDEEAAHAYRRALADDPNEVETWLLWGNAVLARDTKEREEFQNQNKRPPRPQDQAGNKKVCGHFGVLMETAQADDLFTIAIDGLLNAGAPDYAIENALRRLNERIATDPHNFHLYRLAADLNQELRRSPDVERALVQGLVVADDSRSIIMREIIAMASSSKRVNDVIAYGRSLLNVATHLPPGECLSLGTLLLERGFSAEADVAFQRVLSDQKAQGAARSVVERFEDAGLFGKAGKVMRTLLVNEPFDVELLLRLALIEEKNGDFAAAGNAYGRAIELMIGRLPRLARKLGGASTERDLNVGDVTLYLASTLRGLIVSARTPERQRHVLGQLEQLARTELKKLEASKSFAPTLAENPRLHNISKLLRRTCFAFHEHGYGDVLDDELMRRYPKDASMVNSIVANRRKWRSFLDASRLLQKNGADDSRHRVTKAFLSGRSAVEQMIADHKLTAAEKAEVLTLLGMLGYDDLIDKVKASVNLDQTPEEDGDLLITVGLATSRQELVRDALLTNLSRMRRSLEKLGKATRERNRAYYRPLEIFNQIVAAWPLLSEQDRSSAVSVYGMMFEKYDQVGIMGGSYYFLLSQAGRASEIPLPVLVQCVRAWSLLPAHSAGIINAWVSQKPASERAAAVKKLLESVDAEKRSFITSKLVAYLDPTLIDELKAEIPELAPKKPSASETTPSDEEVAKMPATKRIEFQKTIKDARTRMGSDIRQVFTLHNKTLRMAANMLSREELDILLKDLRDSNDSFNKLIAFLLLRQAGRDVEALALMRSIMAMNPQNPMVEAAQSALPRILLDYGWNVQASRVMPEGYAASGENVNLSCLLHDPLAILANPSGDRLTVSERRVYASELMASPSQYLQATRIYFADTRHPSVANNFRLWYRTRVWPKAVPSTADGLVALKSGDSRNILDFVANGPGGQTELNDWLRGISVRTAHDDNMCEAIAKSVEKNGLSSRLRFHLENAAEQAVLSRADIDVIEAIAKLAAEKLPSALAGQMRLLALNDRNRDAHRTAALALACKHFGHMDLARALGRWSVTQDLMVTGTSEHLPGYLETVPKADRKKALAQLLPFMGITNVRVATGQNMKPVLSALLDHGMAAEASTIVDRYLHMRLNLPSFNNYHISNGYEKMVPGIGTDLNGQDDAMAVAVARLDRPDDYERLLRRKGMGTEPSRPPYDKSIRFPTLKMMDNTGALPEPNQVKDINQYVAIQMKLAGQFRQKGVLSLEGHVAGICVLGQWCVDRGLKKQAAALLKQADTLSAGMLSGRLWVADLNRLLGNKDAAEQIELVLLSYDLLPLPRIPAAMEVLAAKNGQAHADAVAFRVARYTNHPKILPRALRHAQLKGMRTAYLDIAERMRKVNTLFLPPRVEPTFTGYPSAAAWSTAIAATAAKLPAEPMHTGLSGLANDEHSDIEKIEVVGDNPEIIYVPILHDGPYSHVASNSLDSVHTVLERCKTIADHLYNEYDVRNLVLEGLAKDFVVRYNKIPVERRKVSGPQHKMIVFRTWVEMLANKEWNLVPASDKPMTGPLTALGYKYGDKIHAALADAKKNGWLKSQKVFNEKRADLEKLLNAIAKDYNKEHDAILKEDPGLQREYAITVTHRNKAFLDNLLAAKGPGLVFFGAAHWEDLKKQLTKRGKSYVLIVPKGLDWPPPHKDDATILADMLKLGCQLHNVTITFGEGGQTVIKIPLRSPKVRP